MRMHSSFGYGRGITYDAARESEMSLQLDDG
jgi:hypothetical protein